MGFRDKAGYLYLKGRSDDMIVSGGENVYPIDVEYILIGHPDIEAAAVIAVVDPEYGQRLGAFLVLKESSFTRVADIQHWLSRHAARYQQPAVILILKELPYTAVGKVDKKKLRALIV